MTSILLLVLTLLQNETAPAQPAILNLLPESCRLMAVTSEGKPTHVSGQGEGFTMRCELKPGDKEGDLLCDITSNGKDTRTGATSRRAVYSAIAKEKDRVFFVAPDGFTHIILNVKAQRFALAQTDATTSSGMLIQKQCSGAAVESI